MRNYFPRFYHDRYKDSKDWAVWQRKRGEIFRKREREKRRRGEERITHSIYV